MRTRLFIAGIMILLVGLACGSSVVTAEPSNPTSVDISGDYDVSGLTLAGGEYLGTATISKVSDTEFTIVWQTGPQTQTGTGTFDGTTYRVNWEMDEFSGTATYVLQPDGSLVGTWTQDGDSATGTETLTPSN